MTVKSLYRTCVAKTSRLIIRNYWGMDDTNNPFRFLAPKVVHDLISKICRIQRRGFLKSSSLRLLLTSGRVTDFELHDISLKHRDAEEIFQALQTSCKNLKTIEIYRVFLKKPSQYLGLLLRSSKSLVKVMTNIVFALNNLYYCDNLRKLILLDFTFDDSSNPCSEVHTKPRYNPSLLSIRILEPQITRNLSREIANILRYCVNIVAIYYDVAESLEYLYEIQQLGKYKLQTTILGNRRGKQATARAVDIASSTCPDLYEVEVYPECYDSIWALRNFHQIRNLALYEPNCGSNDYHCAVHPLLKVPDFGHNLKSLTLMHFSKVDFSTIGICCPNLEELNVKFYSEYNSSGVTPTLFESLISLTLINLHNEACTDITLRNLLSNASSLKCLEISSAAMLTDAVLDEILKNDSAFLRLKFIYVEDLGLTLKGLKKLATRLTSIKYIYLNSRYISKEDAQNVFKDFNLEKFSWIEMAQS